MSITTQEKRRRFRALHQQGTLILPNPWDLGGVRRLERLGAQAIASSSAAYAWAQGLDDFQPGRDILLEHLQQLANATDLPVNADFEDGFSQHPDEVAANVSLAIETGIAGLSIEDRLDDGLYGQDQAVDRIRASKEAILTSGEDVILVGRSEGLLMDAAGLDETIDRLIAYAQAGADVVYAPGLRRLEDIQRVVQAVAPTPVNVLLITPSLTVPDLAALGVRRVSTGSQLAVAAWAGFDRAAGSLLQQGRLPDELL